MRMRDENEWDQFKFTFGTIVQKQAIYGRSQCVMWQFTKNNNNNLLAILINKNCQYSLFGGKRLRKKDFQWTETRLRWPLTKTEEHASSIETEIQKIDLDPLPYCVCVCMWVHRSLKLFPRARKFQTRIWLTYDFTKGNSDVKLREQLALLIVSDATISRT